MLIREIVTVYFDSNIEHMNMLCCKGLSEISGRMEFGREEISRIE
jgi:hypothetical protein